MIGALIGAGLSLYGASKEQDRYNATKALNMQTLSNALGDMSTSRSMIQMGYGDYRASADQFASGMQDEPWKIALDFREAQDSYKRMGDNALNSYARAAANREGYGREALGHISSGQQLILKDQEKARKMQDAQVAASGLTGTAAANQSAQLQSMQADSLEQAALSAGRDAAQITSQTGSDVMGLEATAAGQEMGMADFIGNMALKEAGMLADARKAGLGAGLMHGQTFLDQRMQEAQNLESQAKMRMGVQHTTAPGPDYSALGQAIGGIDFGGMFGGNQPMTAGYNPSAEAMAGLPQSGAYQAGYGVGPYQSAAPGTNFNPYASGF